MIRIIVTMVHGAIIGAIVGLIWWLALGTIAAIYIAALCGSALGLVLALVGIAASAGGRVDPREGVFVSGALLVLAGMLAGVIGLVVWVIRAISG